jgi:16S rRNA G966 N2-methylase RsmD
MEKIYVEVLQLLTQSSLLAPDAVLVVEHDKRFDPGDGPAPLQRYRKLEQGDAVLSFYRLAR